MMPTMTRQQFEEMSVDELMDWTYVNLNDITTEDMLIEFAMKKLDDKNLMMSIHILNAVYKSGCPDGSYYRYDYSMGILETPTPITDKEDIEDLIDFDEDN